MRVDSISLGNEEFEGDNSSYLLRGEGDTAVVDTGVSTPGTKEGFVEGLRAHGVEVAEVDHVFVTHWHADHSGLAGFVQGESGATVHVHEEDAPLVEGDDEAWDSMEKKQRRLVDDWGMPDDDRDELLSFLGSMGRAYGDPPDVDAFENGDRFDVAGVELEAMGAPGHTAGLTCFAVDGEVELGDGLKGLSADGDIVFTGDALLPVYTPNVGGADVRVDEPLAKYLDTLVRIDKRGFGLALPGHRNPIEEPSGRAKEILQHHRDRAGNVIDALRDADEPLNAWEVGARLFGDLSGIHILHGPGESYAHLDHLENAGAVSSFHDGTVRYEVEDADRIDATFPDV